MSIFVDRAESRGAAEVVRARAAKTAKMREICMAADFACCNFDVPG